MSQIEITALTAVNLNRKYLECVPLYVDFWLSLNKKTTLVEYMPKVLILAAELPEELLEYEEWCTLVNVPAEIPSVFASQAIRIFYPSLLTSDFVITSDVDMVPLGDSVFFEAIQRIQAGSSFVICRDVLAAGQYPICYNVASPEVWSQVNEVKSSTQLQQALQQIYFRDLAYIDYLGQHGGLGWYADQEELYRLVEKFRLNGGNVVKMSDRETGHRRLDRRLHPFPINWLLLPFIAIGVFSDFHVHHPVNRYRKYILTVLRILNFRSLT